MERPNHPLDYLNSSLAMLTEAQGEAALHRILGAVTIYIPPTQFKYLVDCAVSAVLIPES